MPDPENAAVAQTVGSFDPLARFFDARAGLPTEAGGAVARAVIEIARARANDLVAELGAGTGEIGVHLARHPIRYVGLDDSPAMLAAFRAKADARTDAPSLAVADCNAPWPLPDDAVTIVFASRVVHLLDPAHVARETARVCRPGGSLILGRVRREPGSVRERMRRRRQEVLVAAGRTPRRGEEGTRRVITECQLLGGVSRDRREAAEWTGTTSPEETLAGWRALDRIGSIAVDPATRDRIVGELREWARAEFGDLDRREPFREHYVIDVVRFP